MIRHLALPILATCLTVVALAPAAHAQSPSTAQNSCRDIRSSVIDDSQLRPELRIHASCAYEVRDPVLSTFFKDVTKTEWRDTSVSVTGIENNGGRLNWYNDGRASSFVRNCRDIVVSVGGASGLMLSATCDTGVTGSGPRELTSTLPLWGIENQNGQLLQK